MDSWTLEGKKKLDQDTPSILKYERPTLYKPYSCLVNKLTEKISLLSCLYHRNVGVIVYSNKELMPQYRKNVYY